GVWIASYLFAIKGVSTSTAALGATCYYLGLTLGRLLSGILAKRLTPKTLIQIGMTTIGLGVILFLLDINFTVYYFIIVALLGIGSGPIYPNMMFINNDYYRPNEISKVMSLQMVIGYMGFGLVTPFVGFIFDRTTISLYPYVLFISSTILILLTVRYLRLKNNPNQ